MKSFEEMLQGNLPDSMPIPSCQQCGKEGWKAIFTCQERSSGHCPYIEEWRKSVSTGEVSTCSWISGIFVLIAFAPFLLTFFPPKWQSVVCSAIFAIGLLFFIVTWVIHLKKVQLHHPGSGVRLQRITFREIEFSRTWLTKEEPFSVEMDTAQQLLYPPSVTALTAGMSATDILRAALIGLEAQKYIQIYYYQSCQREMGSRSPIIKDKFMVIATQRADRPQGDLEKRFTTVLTYRSTSKEAEEWLKGVSVMNLVGAIHVYDVPNPEAWVTGLVAQNVITQGWGEITGTWRKQFIWNDIAIDQIRPEYQIVQKLTNRLATLHPGLLWKFDKQLRAGIASRKTKIDHVA
jgi:hypothetical protein